VNIHDKIIQLRKMVPENGATEAEAVVALELAAKLMAKHGITEEELRSAEFTRDMHRSGLDKDNVHKDPAIQLCGATIAEFCEVQFWWTKVKQKSGKVTKTYANVFGFHGDVEMAEFLMELVSKSMDRSWREYLRADDYDRSITRHQLYWSFRYGFADRINSKLREMIAARKPKSEATGTDLVSLKDALVKQGMDAMLPDLNLKDGRGNNAKVNLGAFIDGAIAGDRVNLNRPLSDRDETRRLK
jgi:hypothetical protein